MKKPVITVARTGNRQLDQFCEAVKQTLDTQTGQSTNLPPLTPLASTATLADLIAAHNALLARVQGS